MYRNKQLCLGGVVGTHIPRGSKCPDVGESPAKKQTFVANQVLKLLPPCDPSLGEEETSCKRNHQAAEQVVSSAF